MQNRGAVDTLPTLGSVLIASLLATLLTPYHVLLYKQVFEYAVQTGAFQNIAEMHPMAFRSADSWLVLLLTLTTAFFLGFKRKWLPFPTLLFLMSAILAFRARRDAWILVIVALWIISDSGRALWYGRSIPFSNSQLVLCAVSVAAMLFLLAFNRQISAANLHAKVEENFPVSAIRYVRENRLAGPLFNRSRLGRVSDWSLRELPVAIDGRTNLTGDERLERSLNTWAGLRGWDSDPDLLAAKLVIADKKHVLTSLLRTHAGYKIIYEDDVAVVFVQ